MASRRITRASASNDVKISSSFHLQGRKYKGSTFMHQNLKGYNLMFSFPTSFKCNLFGSSGSYYIIPLSRRDEHLQFFTQLAESSSRQRLGKHVGELFFRRTVFQSGFSTFDLLSNEMVTNLDVLAPVVKHWVLRQSYGRCIVTPKQDRLLLSFYNFIYQPLQYMELKFFFEIRNIERFALLIR